MKNISNTLNITVLALVLIASLIVIFGKGNNSIAINIPISINNSFNGKDAQNPSYQTKKYQQNKKNR
jgi:hypothetical protein